MEKKRPEQIRLVWRKIDELIPYEHNAKLHPQAQLDKLVGSFDEFGRIVPAGIDADGNLIYGHGRILAARQRGDTEFPCIEIEGLTETQRRAFVHADNLLSQSGTDEEILRAEMQALQAAGFDVTITGFEPAGLVNGEDEDEDPPEIREDDFDEDPPEELRTKRGQIWQLGEHRLMCGDATSAEDVHLCVGGGQLADLALTSPPYGMRNSARIRAHYDPDGDSPTSFYANFDDTIEGWAGLIRSSFSVMQQTTRAQFLNIQMLAANKRDLIRFVSDHSESLVDVIVWDKMKAPPQMQRNVLNNQFEFVFIFGAASRSIPFGNFHGNVNNVIQIPTGVNEFADVHRAVFPVALPFELLKIAADAKTVLDPFGGTGTTLIACEQLGRRCRMMEIDPHYCDVIIDRWEAFTGKKAVLLNG